MAGGLTTNFLPSDDIGTLAGDLVQQRFSNAQSYGNAAYNVAMDYLNTMSSLSAEAPTVDPAATIDVQEVNMDTATIAAPASPDTAMTTYTAPNAPVIEDITIDAISGIPAFDVPTLTLDLPAQPTMQAIADVGEPDPISNPDFPSRPGYTMPTLPTMREAVIPDPPSMTMPFFEGTLPVDDLVCPTNTFQFGENVYSSDLLTATKANLLDKVRNGGTGLGATIEDAIWRRQQERDELALQEAKDRVVEEWAATGFSLPDGVLTTMLQDLEKQYDDARLTASRDISIKQAELALQNTQFAIQQAVALEAQLISYTSQMAQRQLDAAKALIDASIAIFNASVARYNAKIEGYKAQAVVYETRIRGALAQAEIYKTQIEAAKLTLDMDHALVELYKAQLAGVQSLIDCYKAEMEAARIRTDTDRIKLEAFRAKVEAYTAKVNLNVAQFNMYDAAIRGEAAKSQMYGTQVEAYKSRVQAAGIEAEIVTNRAKIQSDIQKNRIEMYNGEVQAFRATIEAEKTRIDSIVNVYQGNVEAYKAETMAESSRIDNVVKAFAARVQQATSVADLYVKEAEVALRAFTDQMNLRGELVKAGAQVASQLAASAMASVNASASIGESDSKSKSFSNSNVVSDAANFSVSNSTASQTSQSQSQSQSTNYNYNY